MLLLLPDVRRLVIATVVTQTVTKQPIQIEAVIHQEF